MIQKKSGPNLEVDEPTADELTWIFEALQDPAVHQPLAIPSGPSREQFDDGRLFIGQRSRGEVELVRYWIIRRTADGAPAAFFIDYGWDHFNDPVREFDMAIPASNRSLGLYLEAHVVGSLFMFANGLAKRLRWSVAFAGSRPLRWYARLGARNVASFEDTHPVTGEPVVKQVYEIARAELEKVVARAGVRLEDEYTDWKMPIWQLLAGP